MADERDIFAFSGASIDGRFDVGEVVGEGGFAVVYQGHHRGLDAKVAIKCLKIPAKLDEAERKQFLESFLAEGRLLHKLARSNRGIVDAIDVGATTSPNGKWVPYIVLEWLSGKSLDEDFTHRRKTRAGGRSLGETIRLLDSAARALATAHQQGIAHRDVKPANIFLLDPAREGADEIRTKVLDFGIAKVKADSPDLLRAFEVTGSSLQAFTPRYGAPEQFDRSYGATGPWTDVFALALILVECVSGESAMDGDPAQLFITASNREKRPTLRAMGHDEGDAVEAILLRALAVDSSKRTPDAGTFWNELTHAVMTGDTQLSRVLKPGPKETSTKREGRGSPPPGDELSFDENRPPPSRQATRRVSESSPLAAPATPGPMPGSTPGSTQRSAGTPEPLAPPPTDARPLPPRAQANAGIALFGAVLVGAAVYWGWIRPSTESATTSAASSFPPRDSARPILSVTVPTASMVPSASAKVEIRAPEGFTAHRTPIFDVDLPEGFVPRGDGFSLDEEATLHVETGVATATTVEELFRSAHVSEDGGQRFVTHEESSTNSFLIAGIDGERSFAERLIVSGSRFARLRIDYGAKTKDRVEPKLEHTLASFTLYGRTEARP